MSDSENRKQYLFVIKELTSREIKRKYSRSKLGIIWSVLNPLLTFRFIICRDTFYGNFLRVQRMRQ